MSRLNIFNSEAIKYISKNIPNFPVHTMFINNYFFLERTLNLKSLIIGKWTFCRIYSSDIFKYLQNLVAKI